IDTVRLPPHYKNKLSKREIEGLRDMVKGKTHKAISQPLFVSEKTIKTPVSHLFSNLLVSARTQAAIYAMENKLI
uniref:response regulator transcription factor n=1 Tax=Staphylococcus aureus TaxID=1280 RepID=UPI000A545516